MIRKKNLALSMIVTLLLTAGSILGLAHKSFQQEQPNATITDQNYFDYFLNADSYVDSSVDITGKIFHFFPGASDTNTLQMYQGNNIDRPVIVNYPAELSIEQREDDCIRIKGTATGSTQFTNPFGATITGATVNASSIEGIDCSSVINPENKIVTVEETQESEDIIVTLHKVEYSDENTKAYLTVNNAGVGFNSSAIDFSGEAYQGGKQYPVDPSYEEINSTIPLGTQEDSVMTFLPLDPSAPTSEFRFTAEKLYSGRFGGSFTFLIEN